MDPMLKHLLDHDQLIPVLAIGGGLLIGAIWIIASAIQSTLVGRSREQTKRELAAYVAEGTLDPDKAIAMINAGRPHWEAGRKGDGKGGCCGA